MLVHKVRCTWYGLMHLVNKTIELKLELLHFEHPKMLLLLFLMTVRRWFEHPLVNVSLCEHYFYFCSADLVMWALLFPKVFIFNKDFYFRKMPHSWEYLNWSTAYREWITSELPFRAGNTKRSQAYFLNPALSSKVWYGGSLRADSLVRRTLSSQILQLASMMVFIIHIPKVFSVLGWLCGKCYVGVGEKLIWVGAVHIICCWPHVYLIICQSNSFLY